VWRRRGWEKSPGSPNLDAEERIYGSPTKGSRRTKRVRSQIPRPDFVVHRGPEEVPEEPAGLQRRRTLRDDQDHGDRKKFKFSGSERVVSGRTFFC
jgi:hypothetical protein